MTHLNGCFHLFRFQGTQDCVLAHNAAVFARLPTWCAAASAPHTLTELARCLSGGLPRPLSRTISTHPLSHSRRARARSLSPLSLSVCLTLAVLRPPSPTHTHHGSSRCSWASGASYSSAPSSRSSSSVLTTLGRRVYSSR